MFLGSVLALVSAAESLRSSSGPRKRIRFPPLSFQRRRSAVGLADEGWLKSSRTVMQHSIVRKAYPAGAVWRDWVARGSATSFQPAQGTPAVFGRTPALGVYIVIAAQEIPGSPAGS